MRYASTALVAAGLISLTCFSAATPIQAQSAWLPPVEGSAISLEVYKASYDIDGISMPTSAWFLSGQVMVGRGAAIYVDLPYSYYDEEYDTTNLPLFGPIEAESTLGNPYIGVVLGPYKDGFGVDFGVRFPMADTDQINALLSGLFTDFYRAGAFLPEVATLRVLVSRERMNKSRTFSSRSRAGVSIWIPKEVQVGRDLLWDYDVNFWYRPGKFAIGGIFAWRFLMSASGGSFTERSEFQLGTGATVRLGAFEPGVHARIPIGNEGLVGLGTAVNFVFGINLTVHLSKPGAPKEEPPAGRGVPLIGP